MRRALLVTVLILTSSMLAAAQGNGFSFQGRLNDGNTPANGAYDLQFKLYDAIAGGNQIGSMVARPNTVLVNGVFSVTLDFGPAAFNSPASVFIEIAVKPNGSPNAYNILGPRQQLTVVPYAVRAMNATNADNATNAQNAVNATNAQTAVNATNAQNAVNATNAQTANEANHASIADGAQTADFSLDSNKLGGQPALNYARLGVNNPGSFQISSDLIVGGNARPVSAGTYGFVKAMIRVADNGTILKCYNGITNSSTAPCGFIITTPSGSLAGIYRINFGFLIATTFVSVTPEYLNSGGTGVNNRGANYRAFDTTQYEVFTFSSGNSADTSVSNFTIIVY